MPVQQTIRIADRESNYQWSQKQGAELESACHEE